MSKKYKKPCRQIVQQSQLVFLKSNFWSIRPNRVVATLGLAETLKPIWRDHLLTCQIQDHPDLVRDQFWDELFPEMPYTAASEDTKIDPVIGSAAQVEVT